MNYAWLLKNLPVMPPKALNDPDGAAAYHHAEFLKFFLKIFFKFFSIHEAYILIRYST
jgi:hypothetical protein